MRKSLLHLMIPATLVLWAVPAASTADGPGSAGAAYLMLPVGPKSIAMGDVKAASAGDPFGWLSNPATLTTLEYSGVGIFHSEWILDTRYDNVSGNLRLNERFTLAGGIVYQYADDIQGYDDFGGETDLLKNYNYQFLVGLGFTPAESFSAGANIKLFQETLDKWSAGGFGFDIGALYSIAAINTRIGFAAQNIGPDIQFRGLLKEPLPLTLRAGAAYTLDLHPRNAAISLALDAVKPKYDDVYLGVGCEVEILNLVAARVGWCGQESRAGSGIAFGAGVKISPALALDYSSASCGDLGMFHMISLYYGIR